jgi:hypothetical protein
VLQLLQEVLTMPKGPQGQQRPADVIGCAITVAKIATGELEETVEKSAGKKMRAQAGGHGRAAHLTKKRRSAIAKKAAKARWETSA